MYSTCFADTYVSNWELYDASLAPVSKPIHSRKEASEAIWLQSTVCGDLPCRYIWMYTLVHACMYVCTYVHTYHSCAAARTKKLNTAISVPGPEVGVGVRTCLPTLAVTLHALPIGYIHVAIPSPPPTLYTLGTPILLQLGTSTHCGSHSTPTPQWVVCT